MAGIPHHMTGWGGGGVGRQFATICAVCANKDYVAQW
jgi:hypothetical protein